MLTSGGTGFSVALTWEVSPSPPRQEVDKFVVELSTDDGETYQVVSVKFVHIIIMMHVNLATTGIVNRKCVISRVNILFLYNYFSVYSAIFG